MRSKIATYARSPGWGGTGRGLLVGAHAPANPVGGGSFTQTWRVTNTSYKGVYLGTPSPYTFTVACGGSIGGISLTSQTKQVPMDAGKVNQAVDFTFSIPTGYSGASFVGGDLLTTDGFTLLAYADEPVFYVTIPIVHILSNPTTYAGKTVTVIGSFSYDFLATVQDATGFIYVTVPANPTSWIGYWVRVTGVVRVVDLRPYIEIVTIELA